MRKVVWMLVILLVGCGNQGEAEKKLAEKVNISGQVFVVTKGQENIKLALVGIAAVPMKEIVTYIKVQMPELESARIEAEAALIASEKANQEAKEAHVRCPRNCQLKTNYCVGCGADFDREMRAIFPKDYKLRDAMTKADKENDKLLSIADYKSDAYRKIMSKFFGGLPTSVGISKTDADGKFTLSLPQGKYALAAKSSRDAASTTENYYWLVWVDTTSPNHSVMLSNDNFFETKCEECVKPKTL